MRRILGNKALPAVWLCHRFCLSFPEVEELLAGCGVRSIVSGVDAGFGNYRTLSSGKWPEIAGLPRLYLTMLLPDIVTGQVDVFPAAVRIERLGMGECSS